MVGGLGADIFIYAANDQDVSGETINGTSEQATDDTIRLNASGAYDFTGFAKITNIDVISVNANTADTTITFVDGVVATADANNDGTAGDIEITNATGSAVTNAVHIIASALTGTNAINVSATNFDAADTITGGAGADTINGGAGADTLTGGAGNDSISGGSGIDSIVAGTGDDTIVGAQDDILLDGGAHSSKDILLIGADFNDAGNERIVNIEEIQITAGNLTISVEEQTEALTVVGHSSASTTVITGTGNDTISGGSAADTLSGGEGDDTITGNNGADSLSGGAGDDLLTGGSGTDTLAGGDGADTISGADNSDIIGGGDGYDTLALTDNYTPVSDASLELIELITLTSNTQKTLNLVNQDAEGFTINLSGTNGHIVVLSNTSSTVNGSAGADNITGDQGNDVITGNAGADILAGGLGNDQFVFATNGNEIDQVTDFNVLADKLVFDISSTLGGSAKYSAGAGDLTNVAGLNGQTIANDIVYDTASAIAAADLSSEFGGAAIAIESDTGNIRYDADGNFTSGAYTIGTISSTQVDDLVDANVSFII